MIRRSVRALRHRLPVARHHPSSIIHHPSSIIPRRSVGACCVLPYFESLPDGDYAFQVRSVDTTFGRHCLSEAGRHAALLLERAPFSVGRWTPHHTRRVAVITDSYVLHHTPHAQLVIDALRAQHLDVAVFDGVEIEPTEASFMAAARWLLSSDADMVVSVGGGSTIDTAKAAILYAHRPPPTGDFRFYVNAPIGEGRPIPFFSQTDVEGRPTRSVLPLPPHIAIPTTAGTGSEGTGFAICKVLINGLSNKTGIASPLLVPTMSLVDASVTRTLDASVVAAAAFDTLAHAVESYTARPYYRRPRAQSITERPLNQGSNPYSDFACLETLRVMGRYLERALTDDKDWQAREQMMWASTLAGTGMGNAGVHLFHGLSYSVCGQNVGNYHPRSGYTNASTTGLVPHGLGVMLVAPACVAFLAAACPSRHWDCVHALNPTTAATLEPDAAGQWLSTFFISLLRRSHSPNGLAGLHAGQQHVDGWVDGCKDQLRVMANAPMAVSQDNIKSIYRNALSYW